MCHITNEEIKNLLQKCRELDNSGIDAMQSETLAEMYVQLNTVIKEFELYENVIKTTLKARKIETQIFPQYEKKVMLTEGRKSTTYNESQIYNELKLAGEEESFTKIVKIIGEKVENQNAVVKTIVAKNSNVEIGEETIKILKLSKKELLESRS